MINGGTRDNGANIELVTHVRCNDANDVEGENKEIDDDTDTEKDPPQYSDYQHNFIESGGLKVTHSHYKHFNVNKIILQISSQSVSELSFYNVSQEPSIINRTSEKSEAIDIRVQYMWIATILFLSSYLKSARI